MEERKRLRKVAQALAEATAPAIIGDMNHRPIGKLLDKMAEDEASVLPFPKDVALGADIIGKRYEYEGVVGRIKVDGVEVAVETLTEAERIVAGEQILKRVSLATNTPVSELRRQLDELAAKTVLPEPANGPTMKDLIRPVLRMVKTSGGLRPMLVREDASNRKDRRIARAKARQPKRLR